MDEITVEDELNMALASAKKVQRESRMAVQDIARLRDRILSVQSRKDTTNDSKDRHS